MSSALFKVERFKANRQGVRRADKVLWPSHQNLFVPTQAIEEFDCEPLRNRAPGWQREFEIAVAGGKKYFCWISLAKRLILARRACGALDLPSLRSQALPDDSSLPGI